MYVERSCESACASPYVVCMCVCVCTSEEVGSRENAKEKEMGCKRRK